MSNPVPDSINVHMYFAFTLYKEEEGQGLYTHGVVMVKSEGIWEVPQN